MKHPSSPIVSAQWLYENINHPNIIVLDASIYADHSKKFIEFQDSIPGTLFIDLRKDFVDTTNELPNAFPSEEQFEKNCQKMGIKNENTVIIYDNRGIYTSPRAWYLFKSMGHQNVFVLNGGLPAYKAQGFILDSLKTKSEKQSNYKSAFNPSTVKSYNQIVELLSDRHYCIIDARSSGRFTGNEAEPRPEIKSGCIKNSINLPYVKVLKNGFYRSKDELNELISSLNIHNKELIFSCGSGITACIILLAAEIVNDNPKSLFDGSWTEWATRQKLFKA
ncbi:MAG: sulfurtransferase [Crocinitomicaceae bacterium]